MAEKHIACLLLMALSAAPAQARPLYRLPVATTACFDLEDARRLTDLLSEKGGPSCRRLSPSNFLLDRSTMGFDCLHISRAACVWVPSGTLKPTSLDDGVL